MPNDRELLQQALPCPFCGGTDISTHEGTTFRWQVAECMSCGAQGSEVRRQTTGDGTSESWIEQAATRAIQEWNTRARLALPEPEPVGYIDKEQLSRWNVLRGTEYEDAERCYMPFSRKPFKSEMTDCSLAVYAAPQKKEWVGLTEAEKLDILDAELTTQNTEHFALVQAIEAKLKEKNNVN